MKKILRICLCICLTACITSGCTSVRNKIAYTVYPVGYLIQRLAGDTYQYQSIQESDTIVQRAQISDSYESILEQSKVFFHIGTLESYYSVYASDIRNKCSSVIDLSTINAVYNFSRYTLTEDDEGNYFYEETPYYEGSAFDTIDTNQKDLYLWNDPIAMLSMAKDIRDWLIKDNPAQEDLYNSNFESLESDLIDLDAQYQSLYSSVSAADGRIAFVSMTASFGNWQKTYGIQVYPVILSRYGVLPNDEQLRAIKERIINDNVKYIAYEPNMTDDMTELFYQLSDELGLERVELSNLSSLSEDEAGQGKDYVSIMYANLNVLQTMIQTAGSES